MPCCCSGRFRLAVSGIWGSWLSRGRGVAGSLFVLSVLPHLCPLGGIPLLSCWQTLASVRAQVCSFCTCGVVQRLLDCVDGRCVFSSRVKEGAEILVWCCHSVASVVFTVDCTKPCCRRVSSRSPGLSSDASLTARPSFSVMLYPFASSF